MRLQMQPDANCFVYSCAMVMDVPAEEIFASIGHRGQTVIWPENHGAARLRGIHIQEVTRYAVHNHWWMMPIEREAFLAPDDLSTPHRIGSSEFFMFDMIDVFDGVLMYQLSEAAHAMAWDSTHRIVYDPSGEIHKEPQMTTWPGIYMFVAMGKMKSAR